MIKFATNIDRKIRILMGVLFLFLSFQISYGQNPADLCSGAVALTVNSSCTNISFSMLGASYNSEVTLSGCQTADRDDGFYKFTGTGDFVTVKTTTDIRHVLAIYSGACGSLTKIKCVEVAAGTAARVSILTTAGTTYTIQIHRTFGSAGTDMSGTICVSTTVVPGGVTNGLGSWYSADGFLTTTGTTVNTWENNIGGNPNTTSKTGTTTLLTNNVNFNPALQFVNSVLYGNANGLTFVGTNTGSVVMVNNFHSGAVIAKWEEAAAGTPLNRVSMEGITLSGIDYLRYDHPDQNSWVANSYAINNQWLLSSGLGGPITDDFYVNGSYQASNAGGTNDPTKSGQIMFGANINNSFGATTDIAEIIFYTTTLTATERNKIESYMATKYGITLGTTAAPVNYISSGGSVYWTGSATYQNDIAGIGRDDNANLSQEKSKSVNTDGMVTMALTDQGGSFTSPDNFNSNLEFMMWGNDNGSLVESSSEVPSGYAKRLPREWVVQETGTVGTVSVQINITGITVTGTTLSDFALIIDQDKDANFLTGTIRKITPVSYSGGILQFDGVDFANGEVFSLATGRSATLPVQFITLVAENSNGQNIISWSTGEISNSSKFEILRSTDGVYWNSVGEILIRNTNVNKFYFNDTRIASNTNYYYRIKEVGSNGESSYSEVVRASPNGFGSLQYDVYPNPAKQFIYVQLDRIPTSDDFIEATIHSAEGKVLLIEHLSEQRNMLNLKDFAPGTYILEVRSSGMQPQRKIFVVL